MLSQRSDERIDDLEIKGFRILQNPDFFCFGMDAVLLSEFARPGKRDSVIDLGSGNGIIPLLMCAKEKGSSWTGLEINPYMAEMAERSALLNDEISEESRADGSKVSERVRFINGDIRKVRDIYPGESFGYVTSNPPYIKESHGLENPNTPVNIARHEIEVTLSQVIDAAAYLLKDGGSLAMVHKPFRIPEIFSLLREKRLEPKRMRLVQPFEGKEPNMVLIEARKNAGEFLKVEPTLIIYDGDRNYTEDVLSIYGKA